MPRPGQSPPYVRLRSDARRHSAGLVFALIFALIGAPASSALRNVCDLCPRTCPMHHERGHGGHDEAPRLKCHAAPAPGEHQRDAASRAHDPSVGRATCGNHAIAPATVLPPMILPAAQPRLIVAAADSAPRTGTAWRGRLADPPDTPPPIGAA